MPGQSISMNGAGSGGLVNLLSLLGSIRSVQGLQPGGKFVCPPPHNPTGAELDKECRGRPGEKGSTASYICIFGQEGGKQQTGKLTCTIDGETNQFKWEADIVCPTAQVCVDVDLPAGAVQVDTKVADNTDCGKHTTTYRCGKDHRMKVLMECIDGVYSYVHTCVEHGEE